MLCPSSFLIYPHCVKEDEVWYDPSSVHTASPTAPSHLFSISITLLIHSERYYKPFHSKSTLKIVPKGLNEMVYDNFAKEKKRKKKKEKKKKKSQKQSIIAF